MRLSKISLKDYTSLAIGGEADMVVVTTEDELLEVIDYAHKHTLWLHILGQGTNTFFNEHLKNLLIIKMEMKGIEFTSSTSSDQLVTSYAGETWDDLVKYAIDKGLWGIENLSYIPGTVGAAPVQNIGAYGVELSDTLVSLRVFDIQKQTVVTFQASECMFSYRDSLFKKNPACYVIISITLSLSTVPSPVLTYKPLDTLPPDASLQTIRDLVIKTRTYKLPDYHHYPNAGSFFKNPVITLQEGEVLQTQYPDLPLHKVGDSYKVPTAWLIEHVIFMKGIRKGNVGTWPQQPLVIVNYGNATYKELVDFSEEIISHIQEKTGILLEREVNNVG